MGRGVTNVEAISGDNKTLKLISVFPCRLTWYISKQIKTVGVEYSNRSENNSAYEITERGHL